MRGGATSSSSASPSSMRSSRSCRARRSSSSAGPSRAPGDLSLLARHSLGRGGRDPRRQHLVLDRQLGRREDRQAGLRQREVRTSASSGPSTTLDERGAYIIIIARFVPGGRTAVTFSAGYVTTFPWRRFIVYDVIAGVVWATYAALLGYFGGKTFEDNPLLGVLLALGIASVAGFRRRGRQALPAAPGDAVGLSSRDTPPRRRGRRSG